MDISSENLREGVRGAMLERPIHATAEIRITPKAKAGDVKLLLDYDDRHRAQEKMGGVRKGRVRR